NEPARELVQQQPLGQPDEVTIGVKTLGIQVDPRSAILAARKPRNRRPVRTSARIGAARRRCSDGHDGLSSTMRSIGSSSFYVASRGNANYTKRLPALPADSQ